MNGSNIAAAFTVLGLLQACSSGTAEEPQLARDAGVGTTGGERIDAGGGSGAIDATEAGSDAPAADGGGAAGAAADSRASGAGGAGGASAVAGANGEAGQTAQAGRNAGGASGEPAAGSGGGAGMNAPRDCGGVTPAAHPPFEAIKKLATTRDEVRILVYGQSISEQAWWSKTKAWLQQTYPGKNLVMEEHARGGCSSQCLIGREKWFLDGTQVNRLPEDVFAWKPDLIIFHVYGDHVDYGYIMRAFKEGCDAFENYRSERGQMVPQVRCTQAQREMSRDYEPPEVLVQSDFVISRNPVDCPAMPTPANWTCFMNELVIPEQVAKYNYTLQDNFHDWPEYIRAQNLDPTSLIQSDDTHLSEPAGTDVMFALTIPHLCYAP